jgi:L-rhamnose mutarotase
MNRRFCLTLDLKDDPKLIAEYRRYHEKIWPEITRSIKDSGIEALEIYLFGARIFMIMEVNEHFSFEAKGRADQSNPKVQEWENLMWRFQQSLPQAKPGEKWLLMEKIFELESRASFVMRAIQVSETNLSKLRLGTNSPRNRS